MKPIYFFIGLLISISIIYVVCQELTSLQGLSLEGFETSGKSVLIPFEIAKELQINPSRIKDFQEIGTPGNLGEYQLKMKIIPRNIVNQSEPLINDIIKSLEKKQTDKTPFKITNSDNTDIFLSDIKFNIKNIENTQQENQTSTRFINPIIEPQIKYLTDLKNGIPTDNQLDRAPLWHNGEIIIPPEEELIITPTPQITHPLTDKSTVPTLSFID
jgi:hypothetical protein